VNSQQEIRAVLEQGIALQKAGDHDAAANLCRDILDISPDNLDALLLLASVRRSQARFGEALGLYRKLVELDPDRPDVWYNRGNLHADRNELDAAEESYRKALALSSHNAGFHANLAIILARLGDETGAMDHYRTALEIDPQHTIANLNLANLLADRGETHSSVALLRKVIALAPNLAEGHYNLALALLRLGDWTNGFAAYEWRWKTTLHLDRPAYRDLKEWRGGSFPGRELIVHAEQGLGDTIQFAKLLGLAKSLGGDVIFHVPTKLERLMKTLPFDVRVTSAHRASEGDYQVPLMSLPQRLKLTPGSIPGQMSYLKAEPERVAGWRQRLFGNPASDRPLVGLVWRGNPSSPVEKGRSLSSAADFAPLAAIDGIRLIALQKLSDHDIEPAEVASGWRVKGLPFTLEYPGPDFDAGEDAFIDTAAIMVLCATVISVCTAPLHLAGALGRPAISLLKSVPDWRWMMERQRTPWYPTMQLVRQRPGEDFAPAIARAAEICRSLVSSSSE
jgi:Flp pilus assembly protein TadD